MIGFANGKAFKFIDCGYRWCGGIGAAVCKSMYEQGAVIGIIDIDINAENLWRALGDRAFFSAGDVGSENSMQAAFSELGPSCLQLMAV